MDFSLTQMSANHNTIELAKPDDGLKHKQGKAVVVESLKKHIRNEPDQYVHL